MTRLKLLLPVALFSTCCLASETYQCRYSTGSFDNGSLSPLIIKGSGSIQTQGDSFTAFRPDGSKIISPQLTQIKNGLLIKDDITKVFAKSMDSSNFAISDRITKKSEQWDQCSQKPQPSSDKKDKIKELESISKAKGRVFFLKERHAFNQNCTVWNDVTLITGKYPAIAIAGTVMMGSNPSWDGEQYSFRFNHNSMEATFFPHKKYKLLISSGDSYYGCGPSTFNYNFDNLDK